MIEHDQASNLREIISNTVADEEVDILALPPRSEKHDRTSKNQKTTKDPDKIHFWITRIIVLTFIAIICLTIYYFSMEMKVDEKIKDEADNLVDIIK